MKLALLVDKVHAVGQVPYTQLNKGLKWTKAQGDGHQMVIFQHRAGISCLKRQLYPFEWASKTHNMQHVSLKGPGLAGCLLTSLFVKALLTSGYPFTVPVFQVMSTSQLKAMVFMYNAQVLQIYFFTKSPGWSNH